MEIIFYIIGGAIIFVAYQFIKSSRYTANDDEFSQAGVKVLFKEKKIIIKGNSYDVNLVQGISIEHVGRSSFVIINVDDFKRPRYKIPITGGGGDKFMQRICTALRKADGPSFV